MPLGKHSEWRLSCKLPALTSSVSLPNMGGLKIWTSSKDSIVQSLVPAQSLAPGGQLSFKTKQKNKYKVGSWIFHNTFYTHNLFCLCFQSLEPRRINVLVLSGMPCAALAVSMSWSSVSVHLRGHVWDMLCPAAITTSTSVTPASSTRVWLSLCWVCDWMGTDRLDK